MQPRPPGAWNGQFTAGPAGLMTIPMGASAGNNGVWPSMPAWQPMGMQMQMQQQFHMQQQMQLANMQQMHMQQQQLQLMQQQQLAGWNTTASSNVQQQHPSDKSNAQQQKQYHFAGRKRSHEAANTGSRPLSNKAAKRAAALAPLVPQGPVVVRAPATAAEAAEVEAWKAERRKNWPSANNVAKKTAEASKLAASGALDPKAPNSSSNNRAALAAVLQKQRALGLAKAAGTADMCVNSDGSIAVAADGADEGFGGSWGRGFRGGRGGRGFVGRGGSGFRGGRGHRGGRGWGRGGRFQGGEYSADGDGRVGGQQQQDGDQQQPNYKAVDAADEEGKPATRDSPQQQQQYQGSRRGVRGGRCSSRGRGGRHVSFGNHHNQHGQGHDSRPGAAAGGRGGYRPHPRRPGLLEALLAVDIRRESSWLLQAIRFLVINNFLQPADVRTAATELLAQQSGDQSTAEAAAGGGGQQLQVPSESGDANVELASGDKSHLGSSSEPSCGGAAGAAVEQQQPAICALGLKLRFPEEVLLHQPLAQVLAAQAVGGDEEDDDDDDDDHLVAGQEQQKKLTCNDQPREATQPPVVAAQDEDRHMIDCAVDEHHDQHIAAAAAAAADVVEDLDHDHDDEEDERCDSEGEGLEGLLNESDTEQLVEHENHHDHQQQKEPAGEPDSGSSASDSNSSEDDDSTDDSDAGNAEQIDSSDEGA